jgi:hypothetical protein
LLAQVKDGAIFILQRHSKYGFDDKISFFHPLDGHEEP